MESIRSLYAFGARLIQPDEGDCGDIRGECGFAVYDLCAFMLISMCYCYCPCVQFHVGFSLESNLHTYSQRKRTIRGLTMYAGKLATGKW